MLSWLMEDAVGEEKEPRNLTLRILAINFAAIHTTSMVSRFFLIFIPLAQHSRRPSQSPFTGCWRSKSWTENHAVPS